MGLDNPEADVDATSTPGAEPSDVTPEGAAPVGGDPATLVARLIESGEWPDPELIAGIVAAGEAVLDPLLAFIRTYPREYERESVLYRGIDILGMIGSPAAIPELVEIIRRYPEDSGDLAADVLGEFGPIAFEPALELVRDPAIVDYPRLHAIEAARHAAGADPVLRARLGEVLCPMLAEVMERVRARKPRKVAKPPDEVESEGDNLSEGDASPIKGTGGETPKEVDPTKYIEGLDEIEALPLEPDEEIMYLIEHLAVMADPEARELIRTAFAEDLADTYWFDEKYVDDLYREGGKGPRVRYDRLEDYRKRYAEHIEYLNRPPTPTRPYHKAGRSSTLEVHAADPPPMPPQEPIRNTGPKVGRNDPCWCGSGKKYKKCHLGKDDSK